MKIFGVREIDTCAIIKFIVIRNEHEYQNRKDSLEDTKVKE